MRIRTEACSLYSSSPRAFIMLNYMIVLHQKLKEELVLWTVRQILNILTLTFDAWPYLCCKLLIIGNHCAKYELPQSKNDRGVCVMSRKTDIKYI